MNKKNYNFMQTFSYLYLQTIIKYLILFIIFLFYTSALSFADELNESDNMINKRKDYFFKNNLSVEIEGGWNGYVGCGARFDYRVFDHISINSGIGAGGWGFKLASGLRYYCDYPLGLAFGLGTTYNTGIDLGDEHASNEYNIEYYEDSGNKHRDYMAIDKHPATVLNFTILYGIKIASVPNNRGCVKLYIETGYGHPLNEVKYDILVNNDDDPNNDITMTNKEKKRWNIWNKPGGFIFSIGVSFLLF